MASARALQRLQTLIWVLIFGGLLAVVYGLSLQRYEPAAGLGFTLGGALAAAVGAVLIVVRARLKASDTHPKD